MKRYNDRNKGNGSTTVRVVCAVIFLLFSFCWLYWFQAGVMAVAQHVLSGGMTHYDRLVGAVIITLVLQLVQIVVYAMTRLSGRTHALTYLPSLLTLALFSSYDVSTGFGWSLWAWLLPLVLVVWGVVVWASRRVLPFENRHQSNGFFSQCMWLNLLQMVVMMVGVALLSNTHAVFHYKAHAETALEHGNTAEALRVGSRSSETDESLTMLRLFALSLNERIGDSLFCYPIKGTSRDMLPLSGSKSRLLLLPDSILWQHFGRRPDSLMTVRQYLDSLETDSMATPAFRDYRLAGYLIDRQLDSFFAMLPRYYTSLSPDSLPIHYREALILFQHQRDTLLFNDSLTLLRWHHFLQYDSIYPTPHERQIRMEPQDTHTYWFYYFYR